MIDLDEMLSLTDAATWLRLTPRELSIKSRGRKPAIPAFRINQRVIRFHPRTVLAKLAADAGVSMEIIAASFGWPEKKRGGE